MHILRRLSVFLIVVASLTAQDVVIVVPFQNLFPEKISKHGIKDLHGYYNKYESWSGFEKKYDCIRTAQVPMNTRGTLIDFDETTGEVCIEFESMLVDTQGTLKPCKFWTLSYHGCEEGKTTHKKPTLLVLNENTKKKYDTSAFPVKVVASDINTLRAKNTLVLTKPWFDATTKQTYSVGTRLVRVAEKDTRDAYGAKLFDSCQEKTQSIKIPKGYARSCDEKISDDQRRALFNELVSLFDAK